MSLRQPQRGYRVNIDTLLLAQAVRQARPGRITHLVDLGAGVGALALCVWHLGPVTAIDLVECDRTLAALAEVNLRTAAAPGRVHVMSIGTGDLPDRLRKSADVVVCNPPFFEPSTIRPPADAARKGARAGSLEPFLEAAALCLGRRSSAFFVYPANGLAELLASARRSHLHPKRLRLVHSLAGRPARIALVELRLAKPGGLIVEPPLIEWKRPGVRSDEVAALIERRAIDRR